LALLEFCEIRIRAPNIHYFGTGAARHALENKGRDKGLRSKIQ